MPAIVALAVRYIIIAVVQLGLLALAEKYVIPLINSAIGAISKAFGATEQQAQDIMANEVLRGAEEVGIFALTLRTKMPLKIAEALGFTTKGFVARALPEAIQKLLPKAVTSATATKLATQVEAEAIAPVIAKGSGWAIKGVGDLLKYVTLVVGTPVGFFYALAQYVDYGAWQNPYQKTFQGLLSYIGIHPDTPLPNAKTISTDTWKRIYSTIEQLKPQGLGFPVSGTIKPYSRDNLAALVDEIAAGIVQGGGQATYKNVIGLLLPLVQLGGKEPKVPTFTPDIDRQLNAPANFMVDQPFGTVPILKDSSGSAPAATSTASTLFDYFASLGQSLPSVADRATMYQARGLGPAAYYTGTAEQNARLLAALKGQPIPTATPSPSAPTTATPTTSAPKAATSSSIPAQVFTGVVSNGVLSSDLTFTPRQNDLINDAAELTDAAHNNIVAFLQTLPGLISYEIKIVSSVVNADGLRVSGSAQKVVVGYNKNGTPKYKTVSNKFAEVILYILTQTGTRAKIATIVLGPTDALTFAPNANDLITLSNQLRQNITTPYVPPNVVEQAPTSQDTTDVQTETPAQPAAPVAPTSYPLPIDTSRPISFLTDDGRGSGDPDAIVGGAPLRYSDTREPFAPSSTHKTITPEQKATADAAVTLSDWFAAIGQSLPSLAVRSELYRWYNLGSVRSYTGATDQNDRLLAVLKTI